MKKWEEQQKNKVHQSRIKNVKAAVSNTGVRKSGKLNKSLNDSRQISSIRSPGQPGVVLTHEQQNSISDYNEFEKNNLQSIPLYRILKLQNLQQYAKELISRGFGYDLKKFNYLNQQQLESLLNEIRVLPGHKTKLVDLLDLISNEMIPELENNSMWNMYSPGGTGQNYNPTLQSSGRSLNKANSAKLISAKQHYQALGKQPSTTKNKQQNNPPNLQRKNSQPHVSTQNRNNHHMYYQGNQRQIKSHTSHIKKRSGQNLGYDYFIDSQDENDGYDEFQEAIESLVNQYNFANNRQIFKDKQQTDESFKNELNELDLEFELEQNIGFKNQAQIRAKLDKAINQATKQPNASKTQSNYSSGNSISSNISSTKNTSMANAKTASTSQTISGSSIGQRQSITASSATNAKSSSISQQPQQTKPSSSSIQKRPGSGVSKPGTQQSSTSTQVSKDVKESTHSRGSSNIQSGISTGSRQSEKEPIKAVKKESQLSLPTKQQEEEKAKQQQKDKDLDSKQKQEIERLKQKLELSKGLAQTAKDLQGQLQQSQASSTSQNQSGLHKKARPQTAKYQRSVQYVQDDQCLIPEYDENDKLILNFKENRLIKNIMKNTKGKNETTDELNPQLDYDTIKHMYMSFDGGRLTSTLVNLDIEEMCFCFSCAIVKHIDNGELIEKQIQTNKMYNNLHQIEEEYEDQFSKEHNSSKKINKQEYSMECSQSINDVSVPSFSQNNPISNNPQYLQPHTAQYNQQYNDTSLNRTTNPIEEPTMIHDDYNQSIINADAEKYLKDEDSDYRSAERQFPQEFTTNQGDFNWKQKKSLSDISERTHEVSHQNNKSLTVDQSNEQSLNQKNNLTNANSRKQFQESRHEIEEILKESLLMNVRDNQSLRRRLEVDNHDDEKEFEYTENEEEEDESHTHEMHHNLKRKGLPITKNEGQRIPFDESLNQYNYLEKNPNSEDEDNEFLSQNLNKDIQKKQANKFDLDDTQNQDKSMQEPVSFNQEYNGENLDEVESEGEVDNEHQEDQEAIQQEGAEGESQLNFSTISRYSMVIPNDEISNKRLFDKTYNYKENQDQIFTQKPTKETIQNYCKNVCISCQLEKQIPIIALVYIERLLNNSGFSITPKNWRKITITSMIMASKIWDDESFENKNFSQAFPMFDVIQINEMERVFLNFIDYNLYIKGSDYAKYYFILREFAQKNKKSFPLRPLDLKTILHLQNNANRAQSNLKEMYQNPLNKSF